ILSLALFAGVSLAQPTADAKSDAQLLLSPYYYGGYPYGYGHYLGKRSADAEAKSDAQFYAPYYYGGYPYGYGHYLGKRSADAKPEAKSDAQFYSPYYYGGYPYGYGHYWERDLLMPSQRP
ncbi:Hypothetical protein FKW44_016149, partial [Caligus rogercresseyi]